MGAGPQNETSLTDRLLEGAVHDSDRSLACCSVRSSPCPLLRAYNGVCGARTIRWGSRGCKSWLILTPAGSLPRTDPSSPPGVLAVSFQAFRRQDQSGNWYPRGTIAGGQRNEGSVRFMNGGPFAAGTGPRPCSDFAQSVAQISDGAGRTASRVPTKNDPELTRLLPRPRPKFVNRFGICRPCRYTELD